jgi:hypothetical protein
MVKLQLLDRGAESTPTPGGGNLDAGRLVYTDSKKLLAAASRATYTSGDLVKEFTFIT